MDSWQEKLKRKLWEGLENLSLPFFMPLVINSCRAKIRGSRMSEGYPFRPLRVFFLGGILAKRFTDTEKWRDPWFCGLTSDERSFWFFLLDTCNLAGIWQVNWPLVKFYIPNFAFDTVRFKGRIEVLNPEKWFIPKFIKFQYGELQITNRLHQRIIFELEKEGVFIPLKHPSEGVKDMDMVKDKDLVKKGGVGENNPKFDFDALWSAYPNKDGRKTAQRHFLATVKTEKDWLAINQALGHYKAHLKTRGTEPKFVKNGATWFNNWQDWIDYKGESNGNRPSSELDRLFDREAQQKLKSNPVGEVPKLFR